MERNLPLVAMCLLIFGCSSNVNVAGGAGSTAVTSATGAGGTTGTGGAGTGGSGGGEVVSLSCPGEQTPPGSTSLGLSGFVRTLADPTALTTMPSAEIAVFDPGGTQLATSYSNPGMDGYATAVIPINNQGFSGYGIVTAPGYLDQRLQRNRLVTYTEQWFFAWLITQAEVDSWGAMLGVKQAANNGILMGTAVDCDGFGLRDVVVKIDGNDQSVVYVDGPRLYDHPSDPMDCMTDHSCSHPFAPMLQRTATALTGRFVVPNVAPASPVLVETFGRLDENGPYGKMASMAVEVVAGSVTAVALYPPFEGEP